MELLNVTKALHYFKTSCCDMQATLMLMCAINLHLSRKSPVKRNKSKGGREGIVGGTAACTRLSHPVARPASVVLVAVGACTRGGSSLVNNSDELHQ